MQFIIIARNGENMPDRRMEVRPRHPEGMDLRSEPYITEGVWQRIDAKLMNVVLANGEKIGK